MATEECFDNPGSLCKWVYERSDGNETLAGVADWFVDRPLKVVLVVVIAWIVVRVLRRAIHRTVPALMNPHAGATDSLERFGIDVPTRFEPTVRDPRRSARTETVVRVLVSTTTAIVWTIVLIVVLGIVGISVGPLIASAGIAGVALGFGAQSLVKDCIAGLFMLIEDQYGIGDVVDLGEASGTVERIGLRATVVRGIDGTVWHVPNGVVQRVGNMSQLWSVAVIDVDVAYDTDLDVARQVLLDAALEVTRRDEFAGAVLDDPEVLGVEALGADGITLRLTVRVSPGTQWALQRAIRGHIKAVFTQHHIEIPFPQRTVWSKVAPPDAPGDSAGGGSGSDGPADDGPAEGDR